MYHVPIIKYVPLSHKTESDTDGNSKKKIQTIQVPHSHNSESGNGQHMY